MGNSIQTLPLSQILEKIVGGGTPSKKVEKYFDGDIPWATVKDLNGQYIEDTIDHITEASIKNSSANLIEQGQVIIATRMALGKAFINKKDMAINQDLKALYTKGFIDNTFLLYSLLSKNKQIKSMGSGTTVKGIRLENLKTLPIEVPSLSEQQKIAAILSSVDDTIEKTEQIIEQTKKVKKGLMQQILTKGIGYTELKDTSIGKIPTNWNVKSLLEVSLKVIGGGTPSRKVHKYYNGDIPWVTVKDLGDKQRIKSSEEYITKLGLEKSSASLIPQNNLIVSTRMAVGKAFKNTVDVAINQDMKGILVNKEIVETDFLLYAYTNKSVEIKRMGTGTTVKGIRLEQLKGLEFGIPPKEEQSKIVTVLSNYDKTIENNIKFKNKLYVLKQGLMQQLLTGKTRVKVDENEEAPS